MARPGLSRLARAADSGAPAAAEDLLSVLVLSPDPRVTGGVTAFVELMKARLTGCRVTSFWVGSLEDGREGRWAAVGRLLAAPWRLARLVRGGDFDVVHLNPSLTYKSAVRDGLLLLALRLAGYRRVLVYIHGWQDRVAGRLRRTPGLARLTAWLLNGTARVLVLAPQFQDALVDLGVEAGRITCTRTMFDGRELASGDEGPPPGRRSVLFMSRFVRPKGIFELVEAFARIAGEFPGVDLVLAGDGPEMARLRARVAALGLEGRVAFPGYVGGGVKAGLLRACSVYALPTYLGEGMPIALLEAMAMGKPLLTAKAGGIPLIVRDPDNGVVLDAVTVDAVEAGLRRLLDAPAYCVEVGRRNAAYAWERFEATQVTAEIEAIYRAIAGGSAAAGPGRGGAGVAAAPGEDEPIGKRELAVGLVALWGFCVPSRLLSLGAVVVGLGLAYWSSLPGRAGPR